MQKISVFILSLLSLCSLYSESPYDFFHTNSYIPQLTEQQIREIIEKSRSIPKDERVQFEDMPEELQNLINDIFSNHDRYECIEALMNEISMLKKILAKSQASEEELRKICNEAVNEIHENRHDYNELYKKALKLKGIAETLSAVLEDYEHSDTYEDGYKDGRWLGIGHQVGATSAGFLFACLIIKFFNIKL